MNLMPSSLKLTSIIGFLIVMNTTMAQQDIQTDTVSKFKGTWAGGSIKNYDKEVNKLLSHLVWRIHHIDNSKKEIELTEMGHKFSNAIEIEHPKRMIYKGHSDGDNLFIELNNTTTKSKFTIKLTLQSDEESTFLKGTHDEADKNKDSFWFYLGRISNDISTYEKPEEGSIEVIVTPPPSTKN